MAKLDDQVEWVNGLWYGEGGTGKTTELATMANLGPIIYVNAEAGLKKRPLQALGIKTDNITVWPEPGEDITFQGLSELHLTTLQHVTKVRNKTTPVGIVFDSVTEIYKKILDKVVETSVIGSRAAGKERGQFQVELKDYGQMTEAMRFLMRRFRDLPCHFAMTALSRREQDDDGAVTYMPAITPALQTDLIGWVDVVCATQPVTTWQGLKGEPDEIEEYLGLFRPHGKFRGKDRLGAIPKWLINPTFERVVGYVNDTLEKDTDPIMIAGKERRAAADSEILNPIEPKQ